MRAKVHIQGMGIIGSLLALKLTDLRVPFTWDDNNSQINAWSASTGCIYPSGDPFDMENYALWSLECDFGNTPELNAATYCFLSKNPPHGGKYKFNRLKMFGVSEMPSMHLNAQALVLRVRQMYGMCRETYKADRQLVIAHGFSSRLDHYLWGWTAKVRLENAPKIPLLAGTQAHCYYMRVGRFKLAYAYPVPMEQGWFYAGSSLIHQRKPRSLAIITKFNKWKQHVLETTDMRVAEARGFAEGWRPVAAEEDKALVRKIGGAFVVKPLWSSGIRHAPMLIQELLVKLKVI